MIIDICTIFSISYKMTKREVRWNIAQTYEENERMINERMSNDTVLCRENKYKLRRSI